MNKYTIVSIGILFLAVLMAVVVFVYINVSFVHAPTAPRSSTQDSSTSSIPTSTEQAPINAPSSTVPADTVLEYEVNPIPLKDVPLTAPQRDIISGLGIDIDTFVITPAMQECAQRAVGSARFEEIKTGSTPSTLEILKLTPCLGS